MAMGQAIVKPEDLRRFAAELKQFSEHLNSDGMRLRGQFQRVGETWRDQEHQRFAREFDQTLKVFNQFNREAEQYVAFLMRKAQAAEEYLRQR